MVVSRRQVRQTSSKMEMLSRGRLPKSLCRLLIRRYSVLEVQAMIRLSDEGVVRSKVRP